MSTSYIAETYSVEIVEKTAYVTALKDSSDSHGLTNGNDFVGNKEECKDFINSKNITEIYGFRNE